MVDVPLADAMKRMAMRQDGLDPDDPAHVAQHERDLDLARGRRAVEELARRGVELGTPDEEELVDLGRAYRPVELAQILDRFRVEAEERTRASIAEGKRHRAYCDAHNHRHAANETCSYFDQRPTPEQDQDQARVEGKDQDQARVEGDDGPAGQLLDLDQAKAIDLDQDPGQGDQGDPGQVQVLDPNPALVTAPETETTVTPKIRGSDNPDNTDRGQAGSYAHAQRGSHVQNGKIDHIRDDDGDDWSPL